MCANSAVTRAFGYVHENVSGDITHLRAHGQLIAAQLLYRSIELAWDTQAGH
jgi:hypothetical protein